MEKKEEEKLDKVNDKISGEEKNEIISNDNKEIENENKEKPLDKKQILQDKLKKIFIDRQQNKYKYNKINLPDNLKYSSDNSNSSIEIKNNNAKNEETNIPQKDNHNESNNNQK